MNAKHAFLTFGLCNLFYIKNKGRAKLKYTNAAKVLPKKLIMEIQKYIQDETLYIPKQESDYKNWGLQRSISSPSTPLRKLFIHIKCKGNTGGNSSSVFFYVNNDSKSLSSF